MYTRLKIANGTVSTTIEAHELIALLIGLPSNNDVPGLLNMNIPSNNTIVPNTERLEQFAQQSIIEDADEWLAGEHDCDVLLPLHIQLNTIEDLFSTTNQLRAATVATDKKNPKPTIKGWWVDVAGRLLYILNRDKKTQFYIADYGFVQDVYARMEYKLLQSRWIETIGIENPGLDLVQEATLTDDFKSDTMRNMVQLLPIDKLRDEFQFRSAADLWSIRQLILSDQTYATEHFNRLQSELRYTKKVLIDTYQRLLRENPRQFEVLKGIFNTDPTAYFRMVKYRVGFELMKQINDGESNLLLRPTHAYGDPQSDGATYCDFSDSINDYFSKNKDTLSGLALKCRGILNKTFVPNESLRFLPNLVAAWFIAEASRNINAIPTSLMLLDLMEDPQALARFSNTLGRPLTWQDLFLHPAECTPIHALSSNYVDLYCKTLPSDTITPSYKYFRGIHPMVHLGSRTDIDAKLSNKQPLSRARQKEGSILLHWLAIQLEKKLDHGFSVTLVDFDRNRPETYLPVPEYDCIAKLLVLSKKTQTLMNTNPELKLKYALLFEHIIPLLRARCSSYNSITEITVKSTSDVFVQYDPLVESPLSQQHIHVIQRLSSSHWDLYTTIFDAMTQSPTPCPTGLNQHKLIQLIANKLRSDLPYYKHALRHVLTERFMDRLSTADFSFVTGLFQDISRTGNALHVVDAILSTKRSGIHVLTGLSNTIKPDANRLRQYIMLQLADAKWLKGIINYIQDTLQLPHLSEEEAIPLRLRLHDLLNSAKHADNRYDKLITSVMDPLFEHYVSNIGNPPSIINTFELQLIASILEINIFCFSDERRLSLAEPILCQSIDQLIQPYYLRCASTFNQDLTSIYILYGEASKRYSIGQLSSVLQKQQLRNPTLPNLNLNLNLIEYYCQEAIVSCPKYLSVTNYQRGFFSIKPQAAHDNQATTMTFK